MKMKRLSMLATYWRYIRGQPSQKTLKALVRPESLARYVKRTLLADAGPTQNPYLPSYDRSAEMELCRSLCLCAVEEIEAAFAELDADNAFLTELQSRYHLLRGSNAPPIFIGRFVIWYTLVRLLRPATVLETGVHDGLSSAIILRSMARNQSGRLISIDLPHPDLPPGADAPGWLVPNELRARWTLCLGDARKLLPALAAKHAPLDFFIHDSDHSHEFQEFEYRSAALHLARPALLLSDDVRPDLFGEVASAHGAVAHIVHGMDPAMGVKIGGIRLERFASER